MYTFSCKDCKDYKDCKIGMHVRGIKRNKNMHNRLDLTHLFLMLKVSKALYTIYIQYIRRMKPLLCTHT